MPTDETSPAEEDWAWRLVKKKDSESATLELGEMYADAPDEVINVVIRNIGKSLIRAGTQMMESRIVSDDDEDDWMDDD